MPTLGCAEEYEAFVVDGLTGQTQLRLPWSSINWSRMRNEVSTAEVTVAAADGGIDCCYAIGGLRPWTQLLRIERNARVVWDGPITGWARPGKRRGGDGRFTIRAHDRFALTMKRLIGLDRTGLLDPGELAYNILNDAGIGTLSGSPYVFTLPASSDFLSKPANKVDSSILVARLERVYDALTAMVANNNFYYAQVAGTLWVNEVVVRELLGAIGDRPVLNEETVNELPGINVDGLQLATVAYGGALGTGKSGYPVISTQFPFLGEYTSAILHVGEQFDRESEVNPLWTQDGYTTQLDNATEVLAAQTATPYFTIEQVELSEHFGAKAMLDDLSNLVPGALIDIDFEDTCAFDVPYIGVNDEYRYWYTYTIPVDQLVDVYSYMPTPVSSDTIALARLERIDVNVQATEGGITETFLASMTPTAEWDGTIPDTWNDPTQPVPAGRYPGA